MSAKKKYPLNEEEELLIIHPEDKPLSPEQFEELEKPIDEDEQLELPDIFKTKDLLLSQGLELISEREPCSGGIFGPIFKLKVKNIKTGECFFVLERTFTEVKDIERRFCLVETSSLPGRPDSEPRYEVVNNIDHHQDKLVIDYLYNEERALRDLQGLTGIPKFYGAVYDDLRGSILMEFIDGPDLSMVLMEEPEKINKFKVIEILEKLKQIYTKAAELGFINNIPVGGTVMLDQKNNPYLADWYLYSQGKIGFEGPIRNKYLQGLQDIENLQKSFVL